MAASLRSWACVNTWARGWAFDLSAAGCDTSFSTAAAAVPATACSCFTAATPPAAPATALPSAAAAAAAAAPAGDDLSAAAASLPAAEVRRGWKKDWMEGFLTSLQHSGPCGEETARRHILSWPGRRIVGLSAVPLASTSVPAIFHFANLTEPASRLPGKPACSSAG